MANTARVASWRSDTISLIKIVLCFYLIAAAPFSYAFSPLPWVPVPAAAAAFGGSAAGAGALTAAGGLVATAAAVAGGGIAAFCAASWAFGDNSCGGGGAIPSALSGAQIKVDPSSGQLVKTGPVYFTQSAYSGFANPVCHSSSRGQVVECLIGLMNATPAGVNYIYYATIISSSVCDLSSSSAVAPLSVVCDTIRVTRAPRSNPTATPSGLSSQPHIYGQTGTSVPTDPEVGVAVAANPAARSAAGAALAQPTLAGAQAAHAAAAAPARTPEAECAAKGMKHGTFNGATFCVGVSESTTTGAPAGATGTDPAAGTGTGTPPAPDPAADDKPTPAFCVWAVTLCNWLDWTKVEPAVANPATTKVDVKDRQVEDVPNLPVAIDTTRIQWSQQCPAPISADFNLMGQNVGWSYKFDVVCDFAATFRPYVIGLSYLTAAYIVMGLNRTRSE